MNDERNTPRIPHNITINDRKNLVISGVEEVVSCDSEIIVIRTVMGELTINGIKLHMGSFNRDNGELKLDGQIKELIYSDVDTQKRGFFSRLLR